MASKQVQLQLGLAML